MVFTNKDLNKNTCTLGEVANFLSIHPKTLQKKDREGLIPFDRTSTNRRFLTRENLIKLLDENNLFYHPFWPFPVRQLPNYRSNHYPSLYIPSFDNWISEDTEVFLRYIFRSCRWE